MQKVEGEGISPWQTYGKAKDNTRHLRRLSQSLNETGRMNDLSTFQIRTTSGTKHPGTKTTSYGFVLKKYYCYNQNKTI